MDINIGGSLKRLRKARDITQEELAESLGVSFQSVSKWERGECFPDIMTLPGLANFFGVSIDELMGMGEIRDQAYLNDIYRRAHEYEEDNKCREAAEILRQAVKTHPNNFGLLSELALALSFEDVNTREGREAANEAVGLCERVLANSTNEKIRSTTRAGLCFLYKRIGEHQKAAELARTLPHVWESRELLLPEFMEEQDRIEAMRKSVLIVLSVICERIDVIEGVTAQALETERMIALGPQMNASDNASDAIDKIKCFLTVQVGTY